MKRRLTWKSVVLGASGIATVGLLAAASTATAAKASAASTSPSWHTVLSIPNGPVQTVVAAGKTSGWAFLANSTVAYERTSATTWKKVAFPGTGGAVYAAGASSPSNVWAAYSTASGTQVDRWNGQRWAVVKSFPGTVTSLSVLRPNDVWVFGGLANGSAQGVFHFDGHRWTLVSKTLQGGYAANDRNVWAFTNTQIEHYDGRKWTAVSVANLLPPATRGPSSFLTGIIQLGPNNVYATGEGVQTPRGGPGVILHYNGRSWARVAESGIFEPVDRQMAADGRGGLWIPANNFPAVSPELFHFSGGKVSAASVQGAVYSVSRVPGTAAELAGGFVRNTSGTGFHGAVFQYS
jgi:hypothetical protein